LFVFVLDVIPSSKHSKVLLICQDLQGFIRLSFIGSVGGFQYNATLTINSVWRTLKCISEHGWL